MTDFPERLQAKDSSQKIAKSKSVKATRPAQLRKLLTRKSGVSIAQIQSAFGWQPHTARAALSGLRKSGETIQRRDAVKGAVYRIVSAGVAP